MDYATSAWIPTSYLLSLAVLLLTMGRISDLYGRKAIFILGFAVFVLGSFLCSVSTSGNEMILFRALQGSGAACITATSAAIITATFPPQERGKALGINAMSVYLGLSLGPPLGSFLTGALGWQSIFWVNIPIGAAVIALAVWKLREGPREVSVPRFDVSGAFSFGVGLISLLTALTLGEERGWTSVPILGSLVLSGISFALFIIIEHRRGAEAMLDLRLFTENRLFAMANLSTLLNYTAYFGISSSFLLLQRVWAMPLSDRMVLLSMPLVMSVLSPSWGGPRRVDLGSRPRGDVLIGLSCVAKHLGFLRRHRNYSALPGHAGLGMGMFSSPNTSAIMRSVR
jgi:MFS family permease